MNESIKNRLMIFWVYIKKKTNLLFYCGYEYVHFLFFPDNGNLSTRPDTADLEIQQIQGGQRHSPAPSLALTEGDYGETERSGKRSTLQRWAAGRWKYLGDKLK